MHEEQLRAAANCALCHKPFGSTGLPLFWRMRLQRWGLDMKAVKRQDGLTAMLGGHAWLAMVMGANEPMAHRLSTVEVTICERCADRASLFVVSELPEVEHDEPNFGAAQR